MAVISVVAFQVKPGRMEDFLRTTKEGNRIVEGLAVGLRSIRVFRSMIGGPNTGTAVVAFEYEDLASWGKTNDIEMKDPAFLAMMANVAAADSPATIVSRELFTETPL